MKGFPSSRRRTEGRTRVIMLRSLCRVLEKVWRYRPLLWEATPSPPSRVCPTAHHNTISFNSPSLHHHNSPSFHHTHSTIPPLAYRKTQHKTITLNRRLLLSTQAPYLTLPRHHDRADSPGPEASELISIITTLDGDGCLAGGRADAPVAEITLLQMLGCNAAMWKRS